MIATDRRTLLFSSFVKDILVWASSEAVTGYTNNAGQKTATEQPSLGCFCRQNKPSGHVYAFMEFLKVERFVETFLIQTAAQNLIG